MKHRLFVVLSILTVAISVGATQGVSPSGSEQQVVLDRYCATCHSEQRKAGGLVLEHLDLGNAAGHASTLEKVVKRLRNGTMPPSSVSKIGRAHV